MEAIELDEAMKTIDSCLSQMNWSLKSSSKRRLQLGTSHFISFNFLQSILFFTFNSISRITDIIALITRMRPVVMIDYGGIMPQLQHQLSSLLQLAQNQSQIFQQLRLMVIQEMIYFIHVTELTHFVNSSLDSKLLFVDLEHESPQVD